VCMYDAPGWPLSANIKISASMAQARVISELLPAIHSGCLFIQNVCVFYVCNNIILNRKKFVEPESCEIQHQDLPDLLDEKSTAVPKENGDRVWTRNPTLLLLTCSSTNAISACLKRGK
jgi:hypothetical protein